MTISWSSVHGRGSTREARNVFACLPKSWTGTQTLDALLSRLVHAMNALVDGVLPMVGWDGLPNPDGGRQLASGWRLAPILAVADWDFLSSVCGFPTGQSVPEMCWICGASPTGCNGFCNVSKAAAVARIIHCKPNRKRQTALRTHGYQGASFGRFLARRNAWHG